MKNNFNCICLFARRKTKEIDKMTKVKKNKFLIVF